MKVNVAATTRPCVVCHPDGQPRTFEMKEKDGTISIIPTWHRVPKFYEGPCLMLPESKQLAAGAA